MAVGDMSGKQMEQIDYLMCLVIWNIYIATFNRSMRAFGEKQKSIESQSELKTGNCGGQRQRGRR